MTDEEKLIRVPAVVGISLVFAFFVQALAEILFPGSWVAKMGTLLSGVSIVLGGAFLASVWGQIAWSGWKQSEKTNQFGVLPKDKKLYVIENNIVHLPSEIPDGGLVVGMEDKRLPYMGENSEKWSHYSQKFPDVTEMSSKEFDEFRNIVNKQRM